MHPADFKPFPNSRAMDRPDMFTGAATGLARVRGSVSGRAALSMEGERKMPEARYWRVRMKVAGDHDVSVEAWERGEVGVWYGAWSADEWQEACRAQPDDPWNILREHPHQQELGWNSRPDIGVVRRLEAIGPDDWVVVFLRQRAEFGLAQLEPGMYSHENHALNQPYPDRGAKEVFKFRRIKTSKVFKLMDWPDAYHLLAAQGRGNVHEFHGMRPHVRLLAESESAAMLRATLAALPFDCLIDFLGASAWESLCTAYLTLEQGFVPTGLSTGMTLPTFDIVGRRVPDGLHVFAQCKKNSGSVSIDDGFAAAVSAHNGPYKAFYFAYGGCHGEIPLDTEVIGRAEILLWAQTERGAMYRRFLLGQES